MGAEMTDRIRAFLDAEQRPTPFLVIDLDVVAERYGALVAALPGVDVYYAVKANPMPEVLEVLAGLGSHFDVASWGEVEACLAAGVSGDRISFGNTIKRRDVIGASYDVGVRNFAFDSEAELDKIIEQAPGSVATCRILCDGTGSAWPLAEKFGVTPEVAAPMLIRAASAGLGVGISFHVGSQQRDVTAWDRALDDFAGLIKDLANNGVELAVLNLGGGFGSLYVDGVTPTAAEYGAAILGAVDARLGSVTSAPMIVEPGRFLVGDAGVIETEVLLVSKKDPALDEQWVFIDIGVFSGLFEVMGEAIRYPIRTPYDDLGTADGPVIIAGPTCDSVDVLYQHCGYRLPVDVAEGDRLQLLTTGAYTTTYSTVGFNGFAPLVCYSIPPSATA